MGKPAAPTPEKYCKNCGERLHRSRYGNRLEDMGAFLRRVFRDRLCMAAFMEGQIKKPSEQSGRLQSGKLAEDNCQTCGRSVSETRLYVHHKDENPLNNDLSNLVTLCGSCHRRSHSPNYMGTSERRRPCEYCEAPSIKKGLCYTHLTRLKTFGHPLAKKRKIGSRWVLMLHDGVSWLPFPSQQESRTASAGSGDTATRSSRPKRRSSSAPTSTSPENEP